MQELTQSFYLFSDRYVEGLRSFLIYQGGEEDFLSQFKVFMEVRLI